MSKNWLFLFTSHSLFALTTLTVTLDTDRNPEGIGEVGDLRYYLNSMNQSLNTMPDDYLIAFAFPMTIYLNGILPIINNSSNPVNITIGNPGSIPTVTIDGNMNAFSGFFIPTGSVTIQNMIFQNLTAKGGNGGDGISGGGGGMGAGGAIYAPETFLNGSNPSITLMNVFINHCSAIGGTGGSYLNVPSPTGNEGGGGGGGFSGDGGSIKIIGSTGGGGGGGFGGNGGDVTLAADSPNGGGGGGGGGLGSRPNTISSPKPGDGGSDATVGQDGSGYGLMIAAGSGGGNYNGGIRAGGGGGGDINTGSFSGGGGGGSLGSNGVQPQGSTPPGGAILPSGGNGGDGGGSGGGGVVATNITNNIDGKAGSGGYGGGGGGGAGFGASDSNYTVQGGSGGVGGGGGGGGVNPSGTTPAGGGDSLGGGGGGGGGPGQNDLGGSDTGRLGGGTGGAGANSFGLGNGGGGGGGGSGLGGAIFVDSNLNFTIQALSGIPTTFNTSNTKTQAGLPGTGGPGGTDGSPGSASGNSIFLRTNSILTLMAQDADDLLTLGDGVAFTDDISFSGGGTSIFVKGNGTVIYNGTTDYQGNITVNNANFKVNGLISSPSISICRNISFSQQRGTLSGIGTLTGNTFVNSGTISPDTGGTLTLGQLSLSSASNNALGSLVHIEIDSSSTPSTVTVTGPATLAGILEIAIDPNAQPGTYKIITSSAITGTFDSIIFTGTTPNYSLIYDPTFVQFNFLGYPSNLLPPSNLQGNQNKNNFGLEYELYNQLSWTFSSSPEITGYCIYRDGQKIATVNSSTSTYQDHNRKKGVSYSYAITALNSAGNESSPVNVIITP